MTILLPFQIYKSRITSPKKKNDTSKKKWVSPTVDYLGDIEGFLSDRDKTSPSQLMDKIIKKLKNIREGEST